MGVFTEKEGVKTTIYRPTSACCKVSAKLTTHSSGHAVLVPEEIARDAGENQLILDECACSWGALAKFRPGGEPHVEGRAMAKGRHDPDAATVHLDDLSGDGKPEPGPALGLGVGAVHLVELLEDAHLMLFGDARARIHDADGEVAMRGFGANTHFASVGELDGVADQVKENLCQALLIAKTHGHGFGHLGLECELLVLSE